MKKQKVKINLFKDISGNEIKINGLTIGNGAPRIYIQGGTHGGELTYYILEKIYQKALKLYKSGTITIVPISNPVSWNQRVYSSTLGKFSLQDGKDWNRDFPGNENASLADIRASRLFAFTSKYDVIIDLHTSRKSIPFTIFNKENANKDVIKALGFEYNYLISSEADTSMMSVLTKNGKLAFEVECGSHDSFEEQNIDLVSERLLKYLYTLGLISAANDLLAIVPYTFTNWTTYNSPVSGFVKYIKNIGDKCKKGELLCTIGSFDGNFKKKDLIAVEDFVLIKKLQTNIVWTGDELIQGIKLDSLKKL